MTIHKCPRNIILEGGPYDGDLVVVEDFYPATISFHCGTCSYTKTKRIGASWATVYEYYPVRP